MTTRYVGAGGNDGNTGLSWAQRKLTLNGVEDTPVAATDIVYVGPGTYRELLTVDVSGAAGQVISYIGDYTGANTDGVGGVVRITGSDNDQAAVRASCITATSKNYRTFSGFCIDTVTSNIVSLSTSCSNWIIDRCIIWGTSGAAAGIAVAGTGTTNTIQNCVIGGIRQGGNAAIQITHSSTVDNAAHLIQNCVLTGTLVNGILFQRVGGCTVKNCTIWAAGNGIVVGTALSAGQTETANNCIIAHAQTALQATAVGEITEDYNNLWGNTTARTNVAVGANSLAYPPLLDSRWFLQLANAAAANQVISPFDLASYSQLINVAGTSPTATDMRGTAAIGGQREWGALEYDSTLEIEGGGGADLPEPLRVGA